MPPTPITLVDLNREIKSLFQNNFNALWVSAEINELKVNYSGHCYIELIQKDEHSDQILARTRAIIWSNNFRMIQPYFESTTGQNFTEGLKIMVKAKPEYHELYGLSLNIFDIEPTYTVGDLAIRKQKIIQKLAEEGVLDMNKELEIPVLPQRIAVISSQKAAGLGDFLDQLNNNPYQFYFNVQVFQATMQGDEAEPSIIKALDEIYENEADYDVVVIVRGGGSQTDLECFNNYWLASHIAQFPKPVITGIGHDKDETIADLVAHTRQKTPTAVAEFLIGLLLEQSNYQNNIAKAVMELVSSKLNNETNLLTQYANKLNRNTQNNVGALENKLHKFNNLLQNNAIGNINNKQFKVNKLQQKLLGKAQTHIVQQKYMLKDLQQKTKHFSNKQLSHQESKINELTIKNTSLDPLTNLKRGYTITTKNKRVVTSVKTISANDELVTHFIDGKAISKIKNTHD